ncbi:C2H2 transcription facotor [Entomortierella parvispora]|uniref:C2H2 transcription facotor n=1 Tax=Entomortierella parvispora TaxID=205924 RepID=A0A9P3HAF8_9FUNG|nr:C2H2 transcription facotor [Entomortierella parvispora]
MVFHSSTPSRFSARSSSPLSLHSTTADESHRGFSPRLRHDRSQHYTSEGEADDRTEFNGINGNIYSKGNTFNGNNNKNNKNNNNDTNNGNSNGNRPMNHAPQSPLQRVADGSEPLREHEWDDGFLAPKWGSSPLQRLEAPHRPYSLRSLIEPPQKQKNPLEKTDAHDESGHPAGQRKQLHHRSLSQPRLPPQQESGRGEGGEGENSDEEMVDLEELQARTRPLRRQQEQQPEGVKATTTTTTTTTKATTGTEDPAADVGVTATASTPPRSLPPPASSSSSSITSFPHLRRSSPPTQAQNQAPQDSKQEKSIPMSSSISSSSSYSSSPSSANPINKANPASDEGGEVSDKNNHQRGAMDVDDDYGEGDQHGQIPAGTDTRSIPASSSSSTLVHASDTGQSRIGQEATDTNKNLTASPRREEQDGQDKRAMDEQTEDTTRAEAPSSSSLSLSKAGADLPGRAPAHHPPGPASFTTYQHPREGNSHVDDNANADTNPGSNAEPAHADGSASSTQSRSFHHHPYPHHPKSDPLEHNGHLHPHNPHRAHPYPPPPHRHQPPRHTATFPPSTHSSSSFSSSSSSFSYQSAHPLYFNPKETTQRRMLGRSSEPAVSVSSLTAASSAAASSDLTASSPHSHPYHHPYQQHQRAAASPSTLSSSGGRPPYPPQQPQQSEQQYRYHSQQQPSHPNYNSGSSGTGPGVEGAPSSFASAYTGGPSREEGGPPLSNKRRSLADLLFVPIKSKEKRNSSASSASSTDSYRQDDITERERGGSGTEAEMSAQGQQQQPDSHADWTKHPNSSAAATLASLSSSSSSPPSNNTSAPPTVPSVLAGSTARMAMDSPASPSNRRSLSRPSSTGGGGLANRGPRGGSLSTTHLPLSAGTGQSPGGSGSAVSSPKTFQCTGYPGCNMVFTRSEHLARHERKHTGEKPYKCIVANCPRTFSRYDNMIQHTQTHGDRSKRDSLAATAGASASSAALSRSSSVQSTPQMPGRPRGGSSPMVFHDDRSAPSSSQPSPAMSSYGASPAMNYHHHPQGPHHPMQWTHPSGAPATASVAGGYSHGYPPVSSPTTPMIRTLKANSRSLPHLQPRNSIGGAPGPGDSPSAGLQQGMSSMEIEELKRRKSEVLLPSYSRAGGAGPPAVGQGFGPGSRFGRGASSGSGPAVGLGMSPFTPTSSHPQSLPKVEQLTPQEQERLNEHRRSAQAALFKNNASTGSMDSRLSGMREQSSSPYRSSSLALPHGTTVDQEKERALEHRKSTPALVGSSPGHVDSRYQKRSSNDPADMVIQPLPSRDARSGMQWFSQVNAHSSTPPPPLTGSPRSSMTPRDQTPVVLASFAAGEQPFGHPSRAMMSSSTTSSQRSSLDEGSMVLPPILGNYDQQQEQNEVLLTAHSQPRRRTPSSHIHPLSRPSSFQYDPPSKAAPGPPRFKYEPVLAPGLERELEERFYPIRKREVVEEIERMDPEQFAHLRSRVSTAFATEQFRNPEALCNMTAILCVIRSTKADSRVMQDSRRDSRDMEVDDDGSGIADQHPYSMEVDQSTGVSFRICRAVLDVDVDGFRRDPEQGRGDIEDLTLSSRFPITSFVAGFENAPPASSSPPPQWPYGSQSGCPEAARLGRFYLPENSFRPKESLQLSRAMIDPAGPWEVCEFKEFPGLGLWVQQETLLRYKVLAARGSTARQPYRMALTLVERGLSRRGSDTAVKLESRDEILEDSMKDDDDDDVRLKESVLYPDMIERVWSDMFQQYQTHQHRLQQQQHHHQHQQQHHQQHYHHQPYPPPHYHHHPQQQHPHPQQQQQQSQLPPPLQKRVATYEEYQNSLQHQHHQQQAAEAAARRESSYHSQQQQPLYFQPPPPQAAASGAYHEYRQHRPNVLHREDLSSAPSSPRSPSVRDDLQEDTSSSTSGSTSGGGPAAAAVAANMHRRISIAELCNPMQGLATERDRRRESESKRSSM